MILEDDEEENCNSCVYDVSPTSLEMRSFMEEDEDFTLTKRSKAKYVPGKALYQPKKGKVKIKEDVGRRCELCNKLFLDKGSYLDHIFFCAREHGR